MCLGIGAGCGDQGRRSHGNGSRGLNGSFTVHLKALTPVLPLPFSAAAGVAHRFHSTCGKNVALEEDGTRAVRAVGYAHGLVFSTKELKTEEVFEVRGGALVAGPGCFLSSCSC